MTEQQSANREVVGTCSHCEEPVFADQEHRTWEGPFDPEHQECRERWQRRPNRRDMLPLLDDPRYLELEPECVAGAIAVADHWHRPQFAMERPHLLYLGPDADEIVHSWMDKFCNNVRRRARSLTIELRQQRDRDQEGLDRWSG